MNYKKSVIIFGMVLPLGFLLLLIIAVMVGKSKVDDHFQQKEIARQQSVNMQRQVAQLAIKVKKQEPVLNAWRDLIANESRASYHQHWKEAGEKFKSNEFRMQLPLWKTQGAGLGSGITMARQVSMNFEATFRAMQFSLLEVETILPQIQLDSISITPSKGGRTMNFKTTHTVWTKK